MPRIAFAGPIADESKPAKGGFEAANRRTIDLLRDHGVKVLELPYPAPRGSVVTKSAVYGLGFAGIAMALIRRRADWDILHITPHLRHFIQAERAVCSVARRLKRPLLLDLRAGGVITQYQRRGPLYRHQFSSLARAADLIAVEGTAYATFVKQWNGNPAFYFPNYVRWTAAHERRVCPAPVEAGEIRLVTLGRVVPEKGIELSIDLLETLRANGVAASLEIIGGGDTAYISHLGARCRAMPVAFTGPLPPAEVMKRLASRHFFIFASAHPGEGHSNALTEAMACGVVPICSDNGFNRDVVAEAGFVLPQSATVRDYSNCIAKFHGEDELWRTMSRRATARVRDHYSHEHIIPVLIGHYTKLGPAPRRRIITKGYSL